MGGCGSTHTTLTRRPSGGDIFRAHGRFFHVFYYVNPPAPPDRPELGCISSAPYKQNSTNAAKVSRARGNRFSWTRHTLRAKDFVWDFPEDFIGFVGGSDGGRHFTNLVKNDENAKRRVLLPRVARCGYHALGAGQFQMPEFCVSEEIVLRVS